MKRLTGDQRRNIVNNVISLIEKKLECIYLNTNNDLGYGFSLYYDNERCYLDKSGVTHYFDSEDKAILYHVIYDHNELIECSNYERAFSGLYSDSVIDDPSVYTENYVISEELESDIRLNAVISNIIYIITGILGMYLICKASTNNVDLGIGIVTVCIIVFKTFINNIIFKVIKFFKDDLDYD